MVGHQRVLLEGQAGTDCNGGCDEPVSAWLQPLLVFLSESPPFGSLSAEPSFPCGSAGFGLSLAGQEERILDVLATQ